MRPKQLIRLLLLMLLAVSSAVFAGTTAAQSGLQVSVSQLIFSGIANGTQSPARTVTLSNTGGSAVTVNTLTIVGATTNFVITGGGATPITLNPGQTHIVSIAFVATVDGVFNANLQINGTNRVNLRGLASRGNGGVNEPSLQRILDTYRIAFSVGDDEPHSVAIHSLNHVAGGLPFGTEVAVNGFVAAGGQPTFQVLGVYGNNATPVVRVGWYPLGSPGTLNEVFTVNNASHQTLNPLLTGNTSFNPSGQQFGLYTQWTAFSNRMVYSTDSLNTWESNTNIRHKMRFYQLRDSAGAIVPNAYVGAVDEFTGGSGFSFDFNDIVFILRNVQPVTPNVGTVGGQVRVENPLWRTLLAQNVPGMNYLNRLLSIQHIRSAVPNSGGLALYQHNRGVVRLHNDSSTQTLQVTGFNFSDARFSAFDAASPEAPINIYPNSYRDIQVRFQDNADAKGLVNGTLTINTTATNEPNILIQLRGGYMVRDEGGEELNLDQIALMLGITSNFNFPLNSAHIARGDEVLSAFWRRADETRPVYARQIAAFHGCCNATAGFNIGATELRHDKFYGQSIMPLINGQGGPAEMTFTPTGDFTIQIEGYQSSRGSEGLTHAVRFWPVRNVNGEVVPNVYVVLQDYIPGNGCEPDAGGTCDYNDNMYLVTNISPANAKTDVTVNLGVTPNPAAVGTNVTLTATITNLTSLNANSTNTVITLPGDMSIISQTPSSGSCNRSGQQVNCSFGTLGAFATRTVTISASVLGGTTLTTNATVSTSSSENSTSNNAASVTLNVSGTPTIALQAPLNTITNGYGDPEFRWGKFAAAQYYYLYVADSSGQQVINEVLSGAERCTGTTCSIVPTTLRESYRLINGTYTWQVKGWANGAVIVESTVGSFTLAATPPALVTINATTGLNTVRPTFNWALSTASQKNATAFNVVVSPADILDTPVLNLWVSRADACGSVTGGNCTFQAPVNMNSGAYSLFVLSYGPGGSSTGGTFDNGYAGPGAFTLNAAVPVLPTEVAINFNQGLPTISWKDDPNAKSFNVALAEAGWVNFPHFQNYPRTTGANGICNNGTCRVNPLVALINGSYNAAVQGVNDMGVSVGGPYNNGYGVVENQVLNLPAPAAPSSGFKPANSQTINIGQQTYEWNTVAGAISYQLWVGTTEPFVPLFTEWLWAAAPNCDPHPGKCRYTPPLTLGVGEFYAFNVQAYGTGGFSPWGSGVFFRIENTLPGLVTLNTPSGAITDNTPTFVWNDIANVEWYEVWIGTQTFTIYHNQWHRAERGSGKLCNSGTCSLTVPGLTLPDDAYFWNVRAATPAGIGEWQTVNYGIFTLNTPAATVPTLVSPSNGGIVFNTNRPTLTWNKSQHASQYEVSVIDAASTVIFGGAPATLPATTCGATTCSIQIPTPIAYGNYTWSVRAIGLGGTSEWATPFTFLSLSVNTQPMVVNDASSGMQSDGTWTAVSTGDQSLGRDVMVSSGSSGDILALGFEGTGLDVVYVAGPQFGSFIIEVDGVAVQAINANAETWRFGQVASVSGLTPGQHVLRILPVEGSQIAIDAIAVGGQVLLGVIVPTPEAPAPVQPTPEAPAPEAPAPELPSPEVPAPEAPSPEVTPEAPAGS